jgi:hypothetical protein
MTAAQKAKVRVLLCGDIPDPRPAVDSKLKLLDEALEDLEMGEGNRFIALRSSLLDAQGAVRTDIYKPRGDIHLNALGTQIVSLRIQQMLGIMLPNLVQTPPTPAPALAPVQAPVQNPAAPVQAIAQAPAVAKRQRPRVQAPVPDQTPVAANMPPVVGAPLVAAVTQAPAGVQEVVGQVQNVVPEISTAMEVEDEDAMLERLFFKKYGRALPEKEKENEVDNIKFVIDLTDDTDEMEVATPVEEVAVVKTEPIEAPEIVANIANVTDAAKVIADRKERRELVKARKALIAFGKTLRKTKVIPEKEAPEVGADSNVSVDASVNPVEPVTVNTVNVESLTTDEAIEMAEAAIAESDATIAANQKVIDEFDDESEFRLYATDKDVIDDDDAMIDDI